MREDYSSQRETCRGEIDEVNGKAVEGCKRAAVGAAVGADQPPAGHAAADSPPVRLMDQLCQKSPHLRPCQLISLLLPINSKWVI
jgi:hypothetical protein